MRVNEAEKERLASEASHLQLSMQMNAVAQRIHEMEQTNGRAIRKSRIYFEARVEYTRVLEKQKAIIMRLESEVRQKKLDYTTSLRNLEKISDAIHEERQVNRLSCNNRQIIIHF
jgi:hypothetical protein